MTTLTKKGTSVLNPPKTNQRKGQERGANQHEGTHSQGLYTGKGKGFGKQIGVAYNGGLSSLTFLTGKRQERQPSTNTTKRGGSVARPEVGGVTQQFLFRPEEERGGHCPGVFRVKVLSTRGKSTSTKPRYREGGSGWTVCNGKTSLAKQGEETDVAKKEQDGVASVKQVGRDSG